MTMIKIREDMTGWRMWEHGIPDSRLIVINQVEDYIAPSGTHHTQYLCKCVCEQKKDIIVRSNDIKSGKVKSCGCLQTERLINLNHQRKKYNKYDLSGEYGIGFCSNTNKKFYFDLEDYDKIKDYCWRMNNNGRIVTSVNRSRMILLHRLILDVLYDTDIIIDHANRNPLDNRKENLRICTKQENNTNKNLFNNNKSGFIGVSLQEQHQTWRARISVNNKDIHLGCFDNKEDAIKARLEAEAKYFGEFSPQRHLFKEYGINT